MGEYGDFLLLGEGKIDDLNLLHHVTSHFCTWRALKDNCMAKKRIGYDLLKDDIL